MLIQVKFESNVRLFLCAFKMPPLTTVYNEQPFIHLTIESSYVNHSKSIEMKMKTSNLTNNLPIIDRCLLLTYIHTYNYIWISKNFDIKSFIRNNEMFSSNIH